MYPGGLVELCIVIIIKNKLRVVFWWEFFNSTIIYFKRLMSFPYLMSMYAVYGLRTRISCPNYEVVRVFQPVFQPRTVAKPSLNSGFPLSFFKPKDEVCMPRTRDNINRA